MAQQLPLDFPCRTAMERDDFLIAPCNQAAVQWLDTWGKWPAIGLVVYGPRACGKTHLAHVWQRQSGALYTQAADLDDKSLEMLIQSQKPVIVDDLQSLAHEEALFHLYNHLFQNKSSILLLSAKPPLQLGISLPDLRSRLLSLPSVEIESPDEEVLAAVLLKHLSDRQLLMDEDVLSYLLPRMERSYEAVSRLAEEMDRRALAQKRRVTVPLVREILQEQFFS